MTANGIPEGNCIGVPLTSIVFIIIVSHWKLDHVKAIEYRQEVQIALSVWDAVWPKMASLVGGCCHRGHLSHFLPRLDLFNCSTMVPLNSSIDNLSALGYATGAPIVLIAWQVHTTHKLPLLYGPNLHGFCSIANTLTIHSIIAQVFFQWCPGLWQFVVDYKSNTWPPWSTWAGYYYQNAIGNISRLSWFYWQRCTSFTLLTGLFHALTSGVFHKAVGRVKCRPRVNKSNNPVNRLKRLWLCVYLLSFLIQNTKIMIGGA